MTAGESIHIRKEREGALPERCAHDEEWALTRRAEIVRRADSSNAESSRMAATDDRQVG